jgi:hypothetical protein
MAAGHPSRHPDRKCTLMNLVRDVKTFGAGESPKGRGVVHTNRTMHFFTEKKAFLRPVQYSIGSRIFQCTLLDTTIFQTFVKIKSVKIGLKRLKKGSLLW